MTNKELLKENEKLKKLLIQNGILEDDKGKAFSKIKSSYLDENKFDTWNILKKELNNIQRDITIRPKEIYWVKVGYNIGNETYGKGKDFIRAVIILKRMTKDIFIGIPLSTKIKDGEYFYNFEYKYKNTNKKVSALLLQLRSFSVKRILNKIGLISTDNFKELCKN